MAVTVATVPVQGRHTDQGRPLAAAELSQLRPFGDEYGSHDGTDAQYAAQQLGLA